MHGNHLLAECRIPSPFLLTRQNTLLCTCYTSKSCWPCRVFHNGQQQQQRPQRLVQMQAGKGEAADVGVPTVAIYPHLCRSLGCCRLPPAVCAAGLPAAVSGAGACAAASPAGCFSRATRFTSWVRLVLLGRVQAKHGGQRCAAGDHQWPGLELICRIITAAKRAGGVQAGHRNKKAKGHMQPAGCGAGLDTAATLQPDPAAYAMHACQHSRPEAANVEAGAAACGCPLQALGHSSP